MTTRTERRKTDDPTALSNPEVSRDIGVDSATHARLGQLRRARVGIALTVGAAVAWGLLAGWWTPRGPLTTVEALTAMAIGFLVGGVAGLATRSRWAMLAAPVVCVVVFEHTRAGTEGATVTAPHASAYGAIALVVGRGFHGLVALTPWCWALPLGAGGARLLARPPDAGARPTTSAYLRRTIAGLTGVATIVLAALIARPASTAPIVDADGDPLPGSIAELTSVGVDGRDLGLMLRGASTANPVVLYLAGGPGGSERGAMRNHLAALEQDFVVATWDQRGSGTSYDELDPVSTLTLDGAVDDTLEVTDYLRDRFGQEQIYVLSQSWGSILGVLAVQRSPDRYRAFIGTGQMVSPLETDRIIYEDTLAWARERDDVALVENLGEIGPPPYESILDYEPALSYEHEVYPYDHSGNSEGEGGFSENLIAQEYSLVDQVHSLGAFLDTFTVLYPQLQGVDFRRDATSLEVPVYFVQGGHEADGRAEPFDEWFDLLDAPVKRVTLLDRSGHRPLFEQPEEFVEYITETVLAETKPF